jgi:hypothetical protein
VGHVTACAGNSSLQNARRRKPHANVPERKIIFFSLTINGLANKNNASADLSEQLAGA